MNIKQIINLAKNIKTYNFYLYNDFKLEKLDDIELKQKKCKNGYFEDIKIDLNLHTPTFKDIFGKKVYGDLYNDKNQKRPTHYYLNRRISDKVAVTIMFLDRCTNLKLDGFYFHEDKETGKKSLDFILTYKGE